MNHPAQLAVPDKLVFDERGLLPVIAQDRLSGDVLMLAWANAEALAQTVRTGQAHFWSRRRKRLWRKGETSGHVLYVRELRTDCDRDVVLMLVEPEGPACHQGTRTCFGDDTATKTGVLAELLRVVGSRLREPQEGSYTALLANRGIDYTLKKIGEETAELVIAAKAESDERLAHEAADVLFHIIVALQQRGVSFTRVLDVLRERRR
jgi:phosphoribosyl-AMP cyclohydrolase / phosphoribosyl-ATP pyrophosphohydrolase